MCRLRAVAVIAGVLLASVFSLQSFADSIPVLSVDPVSSTVATGDSVAISINISNVTDLYGFQFDLTFAPGTLSAISIDEGAFLSSAGPTFFIPGSIDNTLGIISFTADSLLGPGPGPDGNGTLAVLTLKGLTMGTSSLSLSNVLLLNSNLDPINVNLQNGSVAVTSNGVATPEPNSLVLLIIGIGMTLVLRKRT